MVDIKSYAQTKTHFKFFFLFILVYLLNQASSNDECKFKVQAGSDYTLRCSSNLTYARNLVLRSDKGIILQSEYKILDDHTIEYRWKNIPRVSTYIECYFRNQSNINRGVLKKYVVAETVPEAVTSFKCISYDFRYLKCTFQKPVQYFTTTIVEPSDDEKSTKSNEFTLSQPKYNPEKQQIYNFTIFSKNCFGERSQSFIFNHLENVVPGKPNVSLASVKPNSVVIRLTMHDKLYMETGLLYEVSLLKVRFGVTIKLNTSSLNPRHIQNILLIDNLNAFQRYSLEVKIKSAATEDIPEMWSRPTTKEFQTPPQPPDRPPTVDAGNFHIDPEGHVHLYWETLPEKDYNGENFGYQLQPVDENGEIIRGGEKIIKNSFTMVYNLPKADYEFRIRSVNDEGASSAATIFVPKIPLPPPRKVRSIYNNHTYQLFWESPLTQELVESFTIFSCFSDSSSNRSENCHKDFRFIKVAASVTNVSITGANNFAVGANYKNGSSGMFWVDCVVFRETDIGEIDSIHVSSANSTAINLQWLLTCSQKTLVKGYKLKYCKMDESICFHSSLNSEREDTSILNLSPNTKYIIQISLISDTLIGKFSKLVLAETLEGVPTPPVDLQMCEITETSVELTWKRPVELNGQLRYYKVLYSEKSIELADINYLSAGKVAFNLTRLDSYQVYNISVIAGTSSDSVPSNVLLARTYVKTPPVISYIQLDEISHEVINLTWAAEPETANPMRLYEVKYESKELNTTKTVFIFRHNSCTFEGINCFSSRNNYEFSVRAINIATPVSSGKCTNLSNAHDEHQMINMLNSKDLYDISSTAELELHLSKLNYTMRFLHGPWSTTIPYKCNGPLMTTFVILLALIGLIIIVILITHLSVNRIKAAKEIGIKYPFGMHPNDDAVSNEDCTKMEETFGSLEEIRKQVGLNSQESVDDGYCTGRENSTGSEMLHGDMDIFKGSTIGSRAKNLFLALPEGSETGEDEEENETEDDNELEKLTEFLESERFKWNQISGYNIMELNKDVPLLHAVPDIYDANGYVRNNCLSELNSAKKPVQNILEQNDSLSDSDFGNLTSSTLFDSNGYVLKSAMNKVAAARSNLNPQLKLRTSIPNITVNSQTNSDIFDSNGYVLKSAVSKVFPTNKSPLIERQPVGLGAVKRTSVGINPHSSKIFDSKMSKSVPKSEKGFRNRYSPDSHFKADKFDANGYVLTGRQIRSPYFDDK